MGKAALRRVWIVLIGLAGLCGSGCGAEEEAVAGHESPDVELDSTYRDLESRLEFLTRDTLSVDRPPSAAYRRILARAHTVRDNTKVRLEELRVSPHGVTPEIREEIRQRTRMSLDSLRQLLLSADSARAAPRDGKGPRAPRP